MKMEKLIKILKDLEQGKISADNAERQVLDLFSINRRSELFLAFGWVSSIGEQFFKGTLEDIVEAYEKRQK